MRGSLALTLLLAGTGALASAPERYAVAPAGECAGEERDLALAALPKATAEDDATARRIAAPISSAPPSRFSLPTVAATHLTPTQVAGAPPSSAPPLPLPPAFAGPDACDEPGSGCALKSVDDPDPGSGCGLPGSNCP